MHISALFHLISGKVKTNICMHWKSPESFASYTENVFIAYSHIRKCTHNTKSNQIQLKEREISKRMPKSVIVQQTCLKSPKKNVKKYSCIVGPQLHVKKTLG
jgi:hypothetical protein